MSLHLHIKKLISDKKAKTKQKLGTPYLFIKNCTWIHESSTNLSKYLLTQTALLFIKNKFKHNNLQTSFVLHVWQLKRNGKTNLFKIIELNGKVITLLMCRWILEICTNIRFITKKIPINPTYFEHWSIHFVSSFQLYIIEKPQSFLILWTKMSK
jgi:hypothetical protein